MTVPAHHKQIFQYLRERFGEPASVHAYRDNSGHSPVDIGAFGASKKCFYSTSGVCDRKLKIPAGRFELAAIGGHEWLPKALASSLYWLRDRAIDSWPMVCEDTVKHNAKSNFRHMAFVPSAQNYALSSGEPVRWLLGFPIKDSESTIDLDAAQQKGSGLFPAWIGQTCRIGTWKVRR